MGGLKSAAAGAGDIDPLGIDIGTRQQVIEGANSIPNFPTCEISAGKVGQIPEDCMFCANQVITTLFLLWIPELAAFALANGIPVDDNITALHQTLAQRLIMHLPIFRVATRN